MRSLSTRQWVFLLGLGAGALICIRLGFWQLSRLAERRANNSMIEARMAMPIVDLSDELDAPDDIEHRKVRVFGSLDSNYEILLRNRSLDGQPGYHLVSPLRLEGSGTAVLIDRGWIPAEAGFAADLDKYAVASLIHIEGIAKRSQPEPTWSLIADPIPTDPDESLDAWRVLNIEGIQLQTPYPLLPVFILQTSLTGEGEELPIPDPTIDLSNGPHLGYAIQWFAFSFIALGGGILWLRQKRSLSLSKLAES